MRFGHSIFVIGLLLLGACSPGPSSVGESTDSPSSRITQPHLPFNPSPRSELTASHKKVFAHYFPPYPISIDNKPAGNDYYARHYLKPTGENRKFYQQGGLLRQRPLPRAPVLGDEDFQVADLRQEIANAASIGLDGFAVNIMKMDGRNWDQTLRLMEIAEKDFEDFHIVLMPDMNAEFRQYPEKLIELITILAQKKAAYRLADGRLVVAPYMAERQTAEWWQNQKQQLKLSGIDIALIPVFHNWEKSLKQADNFLRNENPLFYGVSDWGPRTALGASRLSGEGDLPKSLGLKWISPVAPQDVRPKSLIYHEASNSSAFRNMWESAIKTDADWVHIVSWNDYSEGTEIAPSTSTGHAFFDLTQYYTQYFKTGQQPQIVRDVIYAFYRVHHTDMVPGLENILPMRLVGGLFNKNEIEMLAFLTEPATLEIEINGNIARQEVPAGVQSFKIPLEEGIPVFRIKRAEKIALEMVGEWRIGDNLITHNFLYHGMTSGRTRGENILKGLSSPSKLNDNLLEGMGNRLTLSSRESHLLPGAHQHAWKYIADQSQPGFQFSLQSELNTLAFSIDVNIEGDYAEQGGYSLALENVEGEQLFAIPIKTEKKDLRNTDAVYLPLGKWERIQVILGENPSELARLAANVYSKDSYTIRQRLPIQAGSTYSLTIRPILTDNKSHVTKGSKRANSALHVDNVMLILEDQSAVYTSVQ